MLRLLARRLAHAVPLLLGITFLSFWMVDLAPGDFFADLAMNPAIPPEAVESMKQEFGYGQPLVVRYLAWLAQAVHGDLGLSLGHRVPVSLLIRQRLGNTLLLAVSSLALTWSVAVPLGVLVALRRGRLVDRIASVGAFLGMSLPSFFVALLLLRLALRTGWFPPGGSVSIDHDSLPPVGRLLDRLHHLVLPAIVLSIGGIAGLVRLMRATILDLEGSEFVRTARAKGLSPTAVMVRHVLRNALNPFLTLAGLELGTLLGGAALVENVMQLQGLGSLLLQAVLGLDVYVVMASVLIGAVLLLAGNLLADLAVAVVDPRVRLEREGRAS